MPAGCRNRCSPEPGSGDEGGALVRIERADEWHSDQTLARHDGRSERDRMALYVERVQGVLSAALDVL